MIDCGQEYYVAVDYAHTPDGLKNVMATVKEFTPRRLITVFGCGGDRDKTKRPQMGLIAASFSDVCVVTSDNPRSESSDRFAVHAPEFDCRSDGIRLRNRRSAPSPRKRAAEHPRLPLFVPFRLARAHRAPRASRRHASAADIWDAAAARSAETRRRPRRSPQSLRCAADEGCSHRPCRTCPAVAVGLGRRSVIFATTVRRSVIPTSTVPRAGTARGYLPCPAANRPCPAADRPCSAATRLPAWLHVARHR